MIISSRPEMSNFPFTIEDLSTDSGFSGGKMVIVKPGDYSLPNGYRNIAEKIYNFQFKSDDVVIATFPKAGTHWGGELTWTVCHDGDTEAAKKDTLHHRLLFLDYEMLAAESIQNIRNKQTTGEELTAAEKLELTLCGLTRAETEPSPRFFTTHFPFSLLPQNILDICKVVYVARNPMDTCVSFYHFTKSIAGKEIPFPVFFKRFMDEQAPYCPYWSHVKEAWNLRSHPNMCFLTFEEMKQDLPFIIKKVAAFFGKNLSEGKIEKLHEHLTFKNMKANPAVNWKKEKEAGFLKGENFMRKGIIGDWKNFLTPDMEDEMKEWCNARREGCNIIFPGVDLLRC